MEPQETSTTTVWVDDEDFDRVAFNGTPNTVASVADTFEAIRGMIDGEPKPILFDATHFTEGDAASWIAFAQPVPTVAVAAAVVTGPGSREGNSAATGERSMR